MRIKSTISRVALAGAVAIICSLPGFTQAGRSGQPNISMEERNIGQEIYSAPTPAAKLKLAANLIKKYPKTVLRPRVASGLADQIATVVDPAEKINLAQEYQKVFTEPSEQALIIRVLIDGYVTAKRIDEAFTAGSEFLTRNPDSIPVLISMLALGTDQAKLKNPKFMTQSLQYGAKLVGIIEANQKPANIDDALWKDYQMKVLPGTYQSMGLLYYLKGDNSEAKVRLTKASELAPTDPFNYLLLSGILHNEYLALAKDYQNMSDGPAKNADLPKVLQSLDGVIDSYAHLIALSEGNEKLQPVRTQYLHDLESYYKYRHNNSADGMQQLIDKYKTVAR